MDERVAPAGDPDRNLTHLRDALLAHAPLRPGQLHAMPVEEPDPEAAAERYARTLREVAGTPPVLDLAHLGLGSDGHTASLVPGDPVLDVTDDGCGLPAGTEPAGAHYGLRWMAERLEALGGDMRLEASMPRGARLQVRVPLHAVGGDT